MATRTKKTATAKQEEEAPEAKPAARKGAKVKAVARSARSTAKAPASKLKEKLKGKAAEKPAKKATGKAAKKVLATAEVDADVDDVEDQPRTKGAKPRYLVVVESPAKAKTIKKYLGAGYTVKASVGHVKDLPKSKLGVDVTKGFKPQYEVVKGKEKVLDEIKKQAKLADKVFLATDPDREGEAIAWHIKEEIKHDHAYRVMFNEITKNAIQAAILKPGPLSRDSFESQQARRILDRLVGYQISPLLWKKVRRGLSAGRVQSVAVRLIVEREKEIKAFIPQEYWTLDAELEGKTPPAFKAKLWRVDGEKVELKDKATTDALVAEVSQSPFIVNKVDKKERRRNAPAPFITSKLQQESANRLYFSAKKTMTLSQRLYEGVELGDEGQVALITYMRTDSTRLSGEAVTNVRALIEKKYGKEFLPDEPIVYKTKKSAQDAHEAIRPTSLDYPPERVKDFLEPDMLRLYELIWNRFVACQMKPAVYDQTAADIGAGRATFRANGSTLKFAGYLAVYGATPTLDEETERQKAQEKGEEASDDSTALPELTEGEVLKVLRLLNEQHFTQPPPRFSEGSLVKELEEKGIGRPSTYAAILSTIQDKKYVEKQEGRFYPTELGDICTEELVKHFPNELDVTFTAGLEEKLDQISEGEVNWKTVLKDFYGPFQETLAKAEIAMRDVKREEIPTDILCEKCKNPMVIKWGKMGRFLACTGYPECKSTKDYKEIDGKIVPLEEETTDEICENCAKPMVIKRGRFGRFMACSGYPECKTSKPLSIGVACPNCKIGYLTERRSGRGKIFFGCSRYKKDDPEACKFAAWDRPLPEKCPECESPYLLQKYSKRDGPFITCPNKECDYKRIIPDPSEVGMMPSSVSAAGAAGTAAVVIAPPTSPTAA